MKIPFFKENYYLKYSLIHNVGYEFYDKQLVITIDFANWMQKSYDENQPGHTLGNLIFSGVENITISEKNFILNSNEILDLRSELISSDPNIVQIGFMVDEPEGFVILTFKALEVEWLPIFSFFEE